jgi:hypothetical protein
LYLLKTFGSPKSVVEYLEDIPIKSPSTREIKASTGKCDFVCKDYRVGELKTNDTDASEFIRRFALHILPKRFTSSVRPMGSGVNKGITEQDMETAKLKLYKRNSK